jgi:hypothetical protein
LKQVVIGSIHQGDLRGRQRKMLTKCQAAKAGAQNDNVRTCFV